jgi:hypothetical protein
MKSQEILKFKNWHGLCKLFYRFGIFSRKWTALKNQSAVPWIQYLSSVAKKPITTFYFSWRINWMEDNFMFRNMKLGLRLVLGISVILILMLVVGFSEYFG